MDPNQIPQNTGQYDYILNAPTPKKANFFSGGKNGGKKQTILYSIIFVLVIVTIFVVVLSVFISANKKDYTLYKKILDEQTEIIRITDLGYAKARSASIKNYATSIKSITTSEKTDTLAYLKGAGIKIDEKVLASKKDTNNDKTLTAAEQANQYDEKLTLVLNTLVISYQKDIKTLGTDVSTKTERALISTLQANAKVIANTPKTQ